MVWALVASVRLFGSTDRGETWTERALPDGIPRGDASFVSDRDGWMAGYGPAGATPQCQSQVVLLAHTADGGATWERVATSGIAEAQCKNGLSFSDLQHGFLSASDPSGALTIYRTGDGGRSWTRFDLDRTWSVQTIGAVPGAAWALVGVYGDPRSPAIYRSTDGLRWDRVLEGSP